MLLALHAPPRLQLLLLDNPRGRVLPLYVIETPHPAEQSESFRIVQGRAKVVSMGQPVLQAGVLADVGGAGHLLVEHSHGRRAQRLGARGVGLVQAQGAGHQRVDDDAAAVGRVGQAGGERAAQGRVAEVLGVVGVQRIGLGEGAPDQVARDRAGGQQGGQAQHVERGRVEFAQAGQQRGGDAALVTVGQGFVEAGGDFEHVLVGTGLLQPAEETGEAAPLDQRGGHIDGQRVVAEFAADGDGDGAVGVAEWPAARQQAQRLGLVELRQLDQADMVEAPGAGGDERAPERVRGQPRREAIRAGIGRQVIDDPQERLTLAAEVTGEQALDLPRRQAADRQVELLREADELTFQPRQALSGADLPVVAVGVALGAQPEDAAGIGGAEAQRVFLGQQTLADATGAAHLHQPALAAAADTGEHGGLAGLQRGMQLPHPAQSADEADRADQRTRQHGRRRQRAQMAERRGRHLLRQMGGNALGQRRGVVLGRLQVQLVEQRGQHDVAAARLGIDDQHAAARVAGRLRIGLRRQIRLGQLPLAGARVVVRRRVPDQQRAGPRQASLDGALDAVEGVDLGDVLPDPQPAGAQRLDQRADPLGVVPAVAEEEIEGLAVGPKVLGVTGHASSQVWLPQVSAGSENTTRASGFRLQALSASSFSSSRCSCWKSGSPT